MFSHTWSVSHSRAACLILGPPVIPQLSDIVIGAPGYTDALPQQGRALVLLGVRYSNVSVTIDVPAANDDVLFTSQNASALVKVCAVCRIRDHAWLSVDIYMRICITVF